MKKTVKQILIFTGLCLLFVLLFSCDNPISLGARIDINGPVVTILSPPERMPIATTFTLEGTVSDGTGVKILLVNVVINNQELPRQWAYFNGKWQISDNGGGTWAAYISDNNSWNGDAKEAAWALEVNLPDGSPNGEYTIVVQAWDVGDFSDDNSYKTRVVIIDSDPPKINITDPYLYIEYGQPNKIPASGENGSLFSASDGDLSVLRDPANIGKFISRGFKMQYQIDDNSDVWSIEIRLYDGSASIIDEDPETALPENYIYSYYDKNIGPPPPKPEPSLNIKPNGAAQVPALDGDDPSVKNKVSVKTSVVVVGVCYDAAGNINQEKILGSFIYWPKAKIPWLTFPDGMKAPGDYAGEDEVSMVYPGREIKSNAFQIYGVKKVEYTIYKWDTWNSGITSLVRNGIAENTERFGGFSKVFSWSFLPPSSTGYYSIVTKAYGEDDIVSDEFEIMFFVQDVSFPDFPEQPNPSASLPLYQSIGRNDTFENATGENKFRIHGYVSDATAIDSVYLVWINPDSMQYAAMSQLSYFKDQEYRGWKVADSVSVGDFAEEAFWEEANNAPTLHKNKVWKVPLTPMGKDPITDRELYQYSQLIDITEHLNIAGTAVGKDRPLKSQTFLLKAKNPDNKCTIITYAPQGDESAPIITKNPHPDYPNDRNKDYQIKVTITGANPKTCYSGHYELVEQFKAGDKIIVEGEWEEDSIEYLNFEDYLKNNIEIKINEYPIDGAGNTSLTFTPASGSGFTKGTWKAEATLGSLAQASSFKLLADNIKDTLVVSITIKDIGGNITEAGASWLIRSDTLRLLRISSDMADTKYKADPAKPIIIFMEFNKPVQLSNSTAVPELQLNVTGGSVTAKYATNVPNTSVPQKSTQSTKQYFEYIVQSGHVTSDPYLDVTGLVGVSGANYWIPSNYVYSWFTGSGTDREDIKITLPASGHATGTDKDASAYLRRLPVYSQSADQVYSLRGNKNLEIDTKPPSVTKIESTNPAGFYAAGADIFIEVTFDENVKLGDTTPPLLNLQLHTSATATKTVTTSPTTVKVNGDKISFSYTVQPGDTTWGNPIVVTGFTPANSILDIAGNALPATGISGLSAANRTLNGSTETTIRGIEANLPTVPVVKIKTAAGNTNGDRTNIASNNINDAGSNTDGISTGAGTLNAAGAPVALSTLYNDSLWMAIDGDTTKGAHTLNALEYSFNNGVDWVRAPSITSNYYVLSLTRFGDYQIISRQIDKAGNISNWSQPITFKWDPGILVTNITSTSANGTYTHNTDRRTINIRVNFRKAIAFASTPTLTINARTAALTADSGQLGTPRTYLDYTYTVASPDTTSGGNLDVTAISGSFKAKDGASSTTGVEVSSYIKTPATADALLKNNKAIIVNTSALNITAGPTFAGGAVQDDGSWTGTMTITFNNPVSKGTGDITITQVPGTNPATRYRLPAVLTEAQYNKLRSVPSIDTYYTKGTNGYLTGTKASDTSAKYILRFDVDTADITPNASATAGTIEKLASDIRLKEAVEININSQDVTISGNTLTVRLTGSNALQVAGASYEVTYPAGLVSDNLDNSLAVRTSAGATATGITTTGVTKPYIRIKKSQDTISRQTPDANTPLYTAVQPQQSEARMDCRTPGSSIIYRYQSRVTNVAARNCFADNTHPYDKPAEDDSNNPDPNDLGDPATAASGNSPYSAPITLPIRNTANTAYENDSAGVAVNDYQGYQWLVRAVGRTGSAAPYSYSANSEEIAYRTVLTYEVNSMSTNNGDNLTSAPSATGSQVWVRGGDAIGSSTTPGFPLTWADDWNAMSGKRAGIRLLTRTTAGTNHGSNTGNLNNSTWQFVTWEMNVPAYIDIIRGHSNTNDSDATLDAAITWQYGPKTFSYQRDGWTSYKEEYPMFPGKHRWLFISAANGFGNMNPQKGNTNFSTVVLPRAVFTANQGWNSPNTTDATPQ